ncbi:DUF1499 domain-containing protein [Labrys sp. 22185]|uniref:DUF1499 domain-containing protein n=1 Tax=Labrys sp. 22185 TaxID=3453888 RepID=UPI003F85B519
MRRRPAPPPTGWARTAQSLAVFAFEVVLISLVLLRFHLAPLKAGFAALCAGLLAACAALLCAVVAFQVIWRKGERGFGRAFSAFLLAILVLGPAAIATSLALSVPGIVDVSTDPEDPPPLAHATRTRTADANSTAYAAGLAAYQREALPQVQSILLDVPPDDIRKIALRLMRERRWQVVGDLRFGEMAARIRLPDSIREDGDPVDADAMGGPTAGSASTQRRFGDRIEAVASSTILGTVDDIALRIRSEGGKTRIDMRSAARYGSYDFGANAKHVQSFMAELRDRALTPDQASQ